MIILGDSNITDATLTGTNVLSFAGTENLQIFQLSEKYKTTTGTTQIVLDFGTGTGSFDTVALCGTNISSGATITLGYSATNPLIPEATIPLPTFISFNQVWLLGAALNRRYWIIDITDPDPQDAEGVEIGFIYIGERSQEYTVTFPHSPALNVFSQPSRSATLQAYGSKGANAVSMEFTIEADQDGTESFFSIIRKTQNIDYTLMVPFQDSLDNSLYPPMYGILTSDSYGYPMDGEPDLYAIAGTFEERF